MLSFRKRDEWRHGGEQQLELQGCHQRRSTIRDNMGELSHAEEKLGFIEEESFSRKHKTPFQSTFRKICTTFWKKGQVLFLIGEMNNQNLGSSLQEEIINKSIR